MGVDAVTGPDHVRNDVLAEVVFGVGIVGITHQLFEQEGGVEHIDAHGTQGNIRIAWHGRWVIRLFRELHHAAFIVDRHHAESGSLILRHLDASDRHVGLVAHVVGDHLAVVHLVDVVAGEDQYILGLVDAQNVEVLVDGVGRALVPGLFRHPLLRRQQIDELVELAAQETPTALDMLDQAVRLVLGNHADAADAGIHAVGEGKIDDAKFSAEGHPGLGAPVGQLLQAAATASSKDQCDGIFSQQTNETWIFLDHVIPHENLSTHWLV